MSGKELREEVDGVHASIMELQNRLGEAGLAELVKTANAAEDTITTIYYAIPCVEETEGGVRNEEAVV